MNSGFQASVSGIGAAHDRLNVTAHNLANVNTDRFNRSRITHQEVLTGGVQSKIDTISEGHSLKIEQTPPPSENQTPNGPVPFNEGGDTIELSNVDISEEMVNLIISDRTGEANIKAAQAKDEILGLAIDLKA